MNTIDLQLVDDADPAPRVLATDRRRRTDIRLTWHVSATGRVDARWLAAT